MRSLLTLPVVLLFSLQAHAAQLQLVAGGGDAKSDRPASECLLKEPFGVEFAPDGSMWMVEMASSDRLLKVTPDGILKIIADSGKGYAGDGGPVEAAKFSGMHNLAVLPNGDVLLADTWNYRVRKIDAKTGVISTIAGTGKKGFSGDGGPALDAQIGSVIQIAVDPSGEQLLIADIDNRRIRRVNLKTGIVDTVAGNGQKGVPQDGAKATEAPLADPRAVIPVNGGLYILERGGHALRYVAPDGAIKTVAGTGKPGLTGDGGPALSATLNGPKHLCLDRDGTILIADAENHVVRRYDPSTTTITRVAGTGKKGTAGLDGDPLKAELNRPHGVTIAPNGEIYIVDSYNNRVLRIASGK